MLNDDINLNSFTYGNVGGTKGGGGHYQPSKLEHQEAKTPKQKHEFELSPIGAQTLKISQDFSQSLNSTSLKQQLAFESIPSGLQERSTTNHQAQRDSAQNNMSPDFKQEARVKGQLAQVIQQKQKTPSTKPQSVYNMNSESQQKGQYDRMYSREQKSRQEPSRKMSYNKEKSQDEYDEQQESYDKFIEDDNIIKKSIQANGTQQLNYQTASFGGQLQNQLQKTDKNAATPKTPHEQMYTSMSDIGFSNKNLIITKELIEKMIDSASNWKIRTDTIDEISNLIQEKINEEPQTILAQSEYLMEFLVQLLADQNFKIVLTTLMIATLIIPYLSNSSNWHIREELLNVMIICFLKSRNFYDFDAFTVLEAILKLIRDQKERIQLIALEAISAYSSIGNKFSVKEIIYQLVDKVTYDVIADRMDQEMVPFINQQGALEFPFLDQIDTLGNSTNVSALNLPNLSRRESMSSNSIANKTVASANTQNQPRGNSSGRRIVPPSANSMQNYGKQSIGKRTVSAHNQENFEEDTYAPLDQSPLSQSPLYSQKDQQILQTQQNFGFLPALNKNHSQQYNSYYSSNNSIMKMNPGPSNGYQNPASLAHLKPTSKQHSDSQIYQQQPQRQLASYIHSASFKGAQQPVMPVNEMNFPGPNMGYHKNIHSANAYQKMPQQNMDTYSQNSGTPYDNAETPQQRFSAQRSRQTPYQSQNSQNQTINQSQVQSRVGARGEESTPQRKGNTFYSDGSFTTTSTSIPDKIKAMKNHKRIQIQNNNDSSQRNLPQQNLEPNTDTYNSGVSQKSPLIIQNNRAGPIKATRQVLNAVNEQQQNSNGTDLQNLCIDNRKIKPMTKKSQPDIQEYPDENKPMSRQQQNSSYYNESEQSYGANKTKGSNMMRRTNFGQTDYQGDDSQKYVPSDDLQPIENPEKEYKKCLNQMISSEDWGVQFEACNIIRRVCKHHQSLVLQNGVSQLSTLVGQLIKIADSLRSSLSKIALMTFTDMFFYLKRCMEPYLDSILKILLKKGSDTNTFISEEADKAMVSMCSYCQDTKVLQCIMNSQVNAKANPIRQKISKCLETLIKALGNNILFFKDSDKLINQLALYLSDACPEVRTNAKNGFLELSQSIMGQNDLEKLLQRVLNESQYKKVKDFLDKEPVHLVHVQNNASDFLITNANAHYQLQSIYSFLIAIDKKIPVKQTAKQVTLRAGSLNKSVTGGAAAGDQPLNIQATQILKPSQIKKKGSMNNIPKVPTEGIVIDQFFIDSMKDLILKTQTHDWKSRLDSTTALFDFLDQNKSVFSHQQKSLAKLVDLSDTLCTLMTDSNAKIQQQALDRFLQAMPYLAPFIENYILTFYQALANNLASSNTAVRGKTDLILQKVQESVEDKSILVNPLVSMIQFSSNIRLKPLLIDQLIELLDSPLSDQKQHLGLLTKTILPLGYKLLDDNRSDIKQKTEKLLRTLSTHLGQQTLIDACPKAKLQRLCDIILGANGQATFGAQAISTVLNIKGV